MAVKRTPPPVVSPPEGVAIPTFLPAGHIRRIAEHARRKRIAHALKQQRQAKRR